MTEARETSPRGRVQFGAVALGLVAVLLSLPVFLFPMVLVPSLSLRFAELESQMFTAVVSPGQADPGDVVSEMVLSSPGWLAFGTLGTAFCIVLGGFVAALRAKRFRRQQALFLGCILIPLSLMLDAIGCVSSTIDVPTTFGSVLTDVFLYILYVPSAMLGGWLGSKFSPLVRVPRSTVSRA